MREQLLVAGEAVIAGDMWHSTSGFLAGIFMQGGFVLISAVMLRSKVFSKGTAITGMVANGLISCTYRRPVAAVAGNDPACDRRPFLPGLVPPASGDLLKRGQE